MSTLHTALGATAQDVASWLRWHRRQYRYARLIAEIERLDGAAADVGCIAASALSCCRSRLARVRRAAAAAHLPPGRCPVPRPPPRLSAP